MLPSDFDPDFKPYAGLPEPGPDKRILRFIVGGLITVAAVCLAYAAWGHDAIPTAAKPNGWSYPFSCCSGYDCREVPADWIKAGQDGYTIVITGEQISYSDTRLKDSPDGEYHWCSVAGANDSRTICLFRPPMGF